MNSARWASSSMNAGGNGSAPVITVSARTPLASCWITNALLPNGVSPMSVSSAPRFCSTTCPRISLSPRRPTRLCRARKSPRAASCPAGTSSPG